MIWRIGPMDRAAEVALLRNIFTQFTRVPASSCHTVYNLVTISFEYGPIDPDEQMPFQIFIDHRTMDGVAVLRLRAELQSMLNHDIVAELNNVS
jgi:hypothetical protein